MRRSDTWLIVAAIVALVVIPSAITGRLGSVGGIAGNGCVTLGGLMLVWWRTRPALIVVGAALFLLAVAFGADPPDPALLLLTATALVAGERFGGRAGWTAAAGVLAWLAAMYLITGEQDAGLAMFTVPGFVAGTALRLRRETADELTLRGQELEAERELFAQLAVRNERARIASELHDIIGHSLSVMVVQAAAGQRVLQQDAGSARVVGDEVLAVVAESAQQGRDDVGRLVDLLGGQEVVGPDLTLVDEIVALAAGTGLQVTCSFEGDHDGVDTVFADTVVADTAFRIVREALTNALRHAPGAAVRVRVTGGGRALQVDVDNDAPTATATGIVGTGNGLRGLRERVEREGGTFGAGPTERGGWTVTAALPCLTRTASG